MIGVEAVGVLIPLTRGLDAIVDTQQDADRLTSLGKWQALPGGKTHYAARQATVAGTSRTVMMHSVLTGWAMVDHANGDGLDNRRSNLRPANRSQNSANRTMLRSNTSGFKGVGRVATSKRKPWKAEIRINAAAVYLGVFASAEDAARAYDAAATETWGEFACVNFPGPGQRGARPGSGEVAS